MLAPDAASASTLGAWRRTTGLTVRTLRHYEAIGLIPPVRRTASGHRRYVEASLWRLFRVLALKRLGLPLDAIATLLGTPTDEQAALRAVLSVELQRMDARAARAEAARARLRDLLGRLEADSPADPDDLMTTLEVTGMLETYFTQQQRDGLAGRRAEMGEDADLTLRTEWLGLLRTLHRHIEAGTPAGVPEVQALVARWDEIGTAYTKGDTAIRASARRLWADAGSEMSARLGRTIGGLAPDAIARVVAYVDEARGSR